MGEPYERAGDEYSALREWANGYRDATGVDQWRRAAVLRLLAENERLRATREEGQSDG